MSEARLARFIDRRTMEYVRHYPHPIERVWRAITDPAEFSQWFMPGRLELCPGGAYEFGGPDWTGEVLSLEPPRLIRLGATTPEGAPFWFQYELADDAGATRMRFVLHNEPGPYRAGSLEGGGDLPGGEGTPWRPGFLGGWHEFWDVLGDHLDGVAFASRLPKTETADLVETFMEEEVGTGRLAEAEGRRLTMGLRRHERWRELIKLYRAHIAAKLPADRTDA